MSIIRVCTFTALALTTAIASAATTQNKGNTSAFSYDYVEGSFGEYDQSNIDADAFYLGGAIGLDKQLAVLGSAGIIDTDFGDVTVLRGGLLFHTPIEKNFDLFGALELAWVDTDFDDDFGFIATGGARVQIQDNFELEGKLTLTEVDPFDDGLGFSVGARYYLDKQLSAAVGLASDTEFDGIWINLRYNLK